MTSLELREKRANVIHEARNLLDIAKEENRDLTAEEREQWDRRMKEADDLKADIDRIEKLEEQERELKIPLPTLAGGKADIEKTESRVLSEDPEERKQQEMRAWESWARYGNAGLNEEEREIMRAFRYKPSREERAQSVGTGSEGGNLVPTGFREVLEDALLQFGGMRQARTTILRTSTGGDLEMPTANDTSNKGAILAENTQVSQQDVTFGMETLGAYKYTSKLIQVSRELLQDSAFNLNTWLGMKLGERIGRITNEHFTTGNGTGQPSGVVTGAAEGKVSTAAAGTYVVTYEDLVDLQHSVDPAYRGNAEWMFNDTTLRDIKKLTDNQNRPLWVPGVAVREPDTILGHRYVINQDIAGQGANAKSILFGDFSKYIIRDVLDIVVLRLEERYADFFQVGFVAFSRHDGLLLDAGTGPVKYFQNSSAT